MPSELKKAIEEVIEASYDSSQREDRSLFIFLIQEKIRHLEELYEAVKEKL